MRRNGIIVAAGLVLASDAFVLVNAARNRSGTPLATIELTERELHLTRPRHDSTVLFLRLAWEPQFGMFKFEDGPGWFNQTKLEELGFNCTLPVSDPAAAAHYRATLAKEAFAVFEYNEAAWTVEAAESKDRRLWSRLRSIDAGRDPGFLRAKYPDARRFLIVPSLVKVNYVAKWDSHFLKELPGAYLQGSVVQLTVQEISVPPSQHGLLERLSPTNDYLLTPEGRTHGPRYTVVLKYGKNYEPWIESCRLLPGPPH